MKNLTQTKLILYISTFLLLFYNYTFFKNTLIVYPLNSENFGFLLSLVFVLLSIFILLLNLVSSKYTIKPIIITILLISSLTNYFMNSYNTVMDTEMIRNMMQTNLDESLDLLTIKQVVYFLFFGVIPSIFIYKIKIIYRPFKNELISRIKIIAISLVIIILSIFSFSKHYSSFAREHKPLRFSTNPTYWIYSVGKYTKSFFSDGKIIVKSTGEDAKVIEPTEEYKELVIMVVGEAARADHFSLNGYKKETNPLLKQQDIINFSQMYSCGTSTAVSVPCMFSIFDKDDYSYKKGVRKENVLDVLNHTNDVSILWRDNNSDSKGVALRVPYENFKIPKNNTICIDGECRDEGMLVGLDKYIEENKDKDILIVLHQMGNHGPAYYKRYPKKFKHFTPTCETNQLEQCTKEEINNSYDNAILYTDYFLSRTIDFLKNYNKTRETALLYMSDHGESLGENGIYLHGLPYFMAPDSQTHIGSFIWFGDKMKEELDMVKLHNKKDMKLSQDNLFHTLLGIFEVDTKVYNKQMDIVYGK